MSVLIIIIFRIASLLFVNPILGAWLPIDQFLLTEPQSDFLFGGFDSIRSMADVASDLDAHITTNASGAGVSGVGSAQHYTSSLDDIQTFPDHWNDGTRAHVFDQSGEEWTTSQIGIMFLQQRLIGLWDRLKLIHLVLLFYYHYERHTKVTQSIKISSFFLCTSQKNSYVS